MFRFEKYTEQDEKKWDDFVMDKSVNGTFLQTRRFLNYHPKDRFVDESIIIYNKKNNIAAVCPACLVEENGNKIFFSHKGTTFGGIITDKKHYRAKYIIEMVKELKEYCENHKPQQISFYTENQSWYCVSDPCKFKLSFPVMLICENPNMICLKSGANTLCFDRVRCVEIDTEMTVIGTVFTVFCGGRNDKEQEITYTLLAG